MTCLRRAIAIVLALSTSTAIAQSTTWLSVPVGSSTGSAFGGAVSRDGRFATFVTTLRLVPEDDHNSYDVYLWDRLAGNLDVVTTGDVSPGGYVAGSSISDDGRYVAFYAAGLIVDAQGAHVRDRVLGQNICVNVRSDGVIVSETSAFWGRISLSADGRYVAFDTDADLIGDAPKGKGRIRHVYVHDRDADGDGAFDEPGAIETVRVSASSSGEAGDLGSRYPHMSPNGRFVTFMSNATNLVANDTNGVYDNFLRDRDPDANGIFDEPGHVLTERVSVASGGGQSEPVPASVGWSCVSADGRFVAFHRSAANLVPGDTNGVTDVFLRDRLLDETTRISVSSTGGEANGQSYQPTMSDDGRFIVFFSNATNALGSDSNGTALDLLVYDRSNRTTKLASYTPQNAQPSDWLLQSQSQLQWSSISASGRDILFFSGSVDMLPPSQWTGLNQAFIRDRGESFAADVDGAGIVNVDDLIAVILQWGSCPFAPAPCSADLNGNGVVDVDDLVAVILNWSA